MKKNHMEIIELKNTTTTTKFTGWAQQHNRRDREKRSVNLKNEQ